SGPDRDDDAAPAQHACRRDAVDERRSGRGSRVEAEGVRAGDQTLVRGAAERHAARARGETNVAYVPDRRLPGWKGPKRGRDPPARTRRRHASDMRRSEEHTSELQSRG